MDETRVSGFADHYRRLDEWELADIHGRQETLTEEAKEALARVVAERGVSLSGIEAAKKAEGEAEQRAEAEREEKAKRRDARWFKISLWIGIPLIVLGGIFRPERSWEVFVSTTTQTILLVAILYGGRWLWGLFSGKKD